MKLYVTCSARHPVCAHDFAATAFSIAAAQMTSTWYNDKPGRSMTHKEAQQRAEKDVKEAAVADAVVVIYDSEHRGVGTSLEMGACLATGGHAVVVDEGNYYENFFRFHPRVHVVSSRVAAIRLLKDPPWEL